MHLDWARNLRDQCAAASVPFLFKQWGEYAPALVSPGSFILHDSPMYQDYVDQAETGAIIGKVQMLRVGKKRAGRLLDGIGHTDFPTSQTGENHG